MTFIDYKNSPPEMPIGVLTSWRRNTDLSRLEVEEDLKQFFAIGKDFLNQTFILAHTKAEGFIAPDVRHRDSPSAAEVSLKWVKIINVNDDGTLSCVETDGLFEIDDDFRSAFAEVFDFLSWPEFLDETGKLSDLAIRLIAGRP